MIYSRKRDGARAIRNAAFESFIGFNNIDTVEQFDRLYHKSEAIRKRGIKRGLGTNEYHRYIEDRALLESIKLIGEDWDKVYAAYAIRLFASWNTVFSDRYAITKLTANISDTISFSAEYDPIAPIKTPLDKPISIVDSEDDIANILYRLSYDLRATRIFIATGYMFESGLSRLLPALYSMNNSEAYQAELIVGDLYKYAKGIKFKSPNRATASLLNTLQQAHIVTALYTYPASFYHGKFYYISNGKTSYVIMGSSNVTLSAFQKNKEFDVIYRFDNQNGLNPLEQEFVDWYNALKADCQKLEELDESLCQTTRKSIERCRKAA